MRTTNVDYNIEQTSLATTILSWSHVLISGNWKRTTGDCPLNYEPHNDKAAAVSPRKMPPTPTPICRRRFLPVDYFMPLCLATGNWRLVTGLQFLPTINNEKPCLSYSVLSTF